MSPYLEKVKMTSKINKQADAAYLPICIDIKGKECLVVGGGNVALRKITVLRKFGAAVTCMSPFFVKQLERLADLEKIKCIKRVYPLTLSLKKYALVIAATDDSDVNKQVVRDAVRDKILVNVVDKSAPGNVIMPAILKRKGFTISVSTGGRSPSQAKKIRDTLNHAL
ncbi:MAG: bifunctional precorrin-2 dehydrogenase/sirohydrochlorin ferrochelatase [Candidatus Omnitrophica bacterium]|nr:bifunctional precorrin-2 dehydrogenase/sirohydrochlorin ferrochelatase [Candidatus Omnitrophota bacterium]